MKKTLIVISSLVVAVGASTSSSFAHGGGHGHRGHHSSNRAQVFSAKLTPPTGATAAVAFHSHHPKGSTGETGATGTTGPAGKVLFAQNKNRYAFGVRVYKLSANTKYDVKIVLKSGPTAVTSHFGGRHEGPSGPSGSTVPTGGLSTTPPPVDSITTDANGNGRAKGNGLRSLYGLEKHSTYYVTVTNAAGEVVLQGDLVTKSHKRHKGNCNLNKEAGNSFRAKHHH
jgi:hypothetical protein